MIKTGKQLFILLFLIAFSLALRAQHTVSTAGNDALGSGGSVSYSIGQVVYHQYNGANENVSQGVQQPYEISIVSGIDETYIGLEMSTFPNPVNGDLNLKIEAVELFKFRYQLIDIQGKVIKSEKLWASNTTIDMKELPRAVYFLEILDNNKQVKTFKIIK